MNKISNYIPAFIILLIVIFIFRQFFFNNLYPFPGNYLLAWFEPWKSENISGNSISVSHKPIGDDVFRQIYPFKILGIDMLRKFELPLWNPYNGSGMSLFATQHIGFLNPFNIVFFLFEKNIAWSYFTIIQLFLIGFLTYLYCQKILLSKKASLLSTFSFLFSGFVIARSIFGDYDYAVAMLPLILYLLESFIQNNSKKILFLSLVISFLFFSVQPQIIIYILIFSVFYLLYRLINTNNLSVKNILYLTCLIVIGIGLSSIQIVPTLELLSNSTLNLETSKFIFLRFLLPLRHFISVVIPNYFGNQATYNYWGHSDYIESIVYIGTLPIFFALFSLFKHKKNNLVAFFLAGSLTPILLSFDWTVTRFLFTLPIPILSTSVPSRILFLATFSISVLAGFGYDSFFQLSKLNKRKKLFIISFTICILSILYVTYLFLKFQIICKNPSIKSCWDIALRNSFLESSAFLIFLMFALITRWKEKLKKIFSLIPILFIVLLGSYNSDKFLPFSKKETFNPQNELIQFLKTKTNYNRVFGYDNASIKTNFATSFHFFDPNYYDPLYNKRYGELISYANFKNSNSLLRSDVEVINNKNVPEELKLRRDRLFQLLSVSYEIYNKKDTVIIENNPNKKIAFENTNWIITENQNALPRAYLISNVERVRNGYEILGKLFNQDFDPFYSVILETNEPILLKKVKISDRPVIKVYNGNNVIIEAFTPIDSILVLSDNFYPGWNAYIDGKLTKVYRANYTFRGVYVNSGKHLVEFRFEPKSVKFGLGLSILSLFLWLIIVKKQYEKL